MKKNYISIIVLLFFNISAFSQQVYVKNKGASFKVLPSTTVKIEGTIVGDNDGAISGKFYNDGNIYVTDNVVNATSDSLFKDHNGQGNLILNGSSTQNFIGNSIYVENLLLNNSTSSGAALSLLNGDHFITHKLEFSNHDKVITNNNTLVVTNEDLNSIVGYDNQDFIYGTLRRYIDGNAGDFYFYPVSKSLNSSDYHLAGVKPDTLQGTNYVEVRFDDLTNSNNSDLNVSELGTQYYEVAPEGVWHINPDTEPTGGRFDLRCYIDNISGLTDNQFAILSRPEGSTTAADWTCAPCGIGYPGLNPNGGEGRLVSDGYALRRGYDHFSEFTIAKMGCVNVDLGPQDTILCSGDSLLLYPGNYVSYTWSTGASDSAIVVTTSGMYSVTVTDDLGCTTSDSINVIISAPIDISAVIDTPTCSTAGNIDLTVAGGISPYSFLWDDGSTTEDLTDVQPGTYNVTVTDSVGCTAQYTVDVPNIMPNIEINVDNLNNVSCYGGNDGSIEVSVTGGQSPYTYQWNTGDTVANITNLSAGTYIITAADVHGCTGVDSIEITQPDELTVDFTTVDVSCYGANDGEVTAVAGGGTAPYAYSWNTGATNTTITNLGPGQYEVTVTDNNGCTATGNAIVSEPTPIRVSGDVEDPVCYGDNAIITLTPTGGNPPYTYQWNTGDADSVIQVWSGTYTATVTDSHGCDTTWTTTLQYDDLTPIVIEDTTYVQNGYEIAIDVTVSGGTNPYQYNWSTGHTTEDITVSMAGDYILEVTDANGCSAYDTINVDIPLIIPTVFTPNNDGSNDTWQIVNIGTYDDVTIQVFNRWGDVMFEFHGNGFDYTDKTNQWDGTYKGKLVPFGEYLYVIKLDKDIYKGTVLVKY